MQPLFVLADIRINLAVAALKIRIADKRRATMTWASDVKHIQIVLLDGPVQMHVDEVLARRRAPMPNDQRLHMGKRKGFSQ